MNTIDELFRIGILIVIFGSIIVLLTPPWTDENNTVCIGGECGFYIGCKTEVTLEIAREQGVRVLQQQCLTEGWVRDTPYYKELKKEGYARAEMTFE